MADVTIRTETKRTAFISGQALQAIIKAALNIPTGSGAWIRPEISEDQTSLLSVEVEWSEVGPSLKLPMEAPA